MTRPSAESWFGDRRVRAEEKAPLVRGVFDAVAGRYDLMNDLMSFGLHRGWKRALVDELHPRGHERLLDLAGGTGDIAFALRRRMTETGVGGEYPVTVCDINHAMLREGRDRAIDRGFLTGLSWITGDAEALPFAASSVDGVTMAFGIRNVTHIDRALAEIRRVLKPGGRFCCLEFSPTPEAALRWIYDAWSFQAIPRIGKAVTGDSAPYQYLVESIRRFPAPQVFAGMMADAGLARVSFRRLSGGIVAIHKGWRI